MYRLLPTHEEGNRNHPRFAWRARHRKDHGVGMSLFWRISELFFKAHFHRRPLRIDDAVINRVPDAAARGDHVIAEGAFLLGADPRDGLARALVQRVSLEFDADAAQRLEGVPQHQVFRLAVDSGALPRAGDPRPADLDAAVRPVDVSVARRADGPARGALDGGKRQGPARGRLAARRLAMRTPL